VEAGGEALHGRVHDDGLGEVGVPAAEVDGGGLEADAGFDEGGDLAEAVGEGVGLIDRAVCGWLSGGGELLDAFEGGEGVAAGGSEFAGCVLIECSEAFEETGRDVRAESEFLEGLDGGAGGCAAEGFGEGCADGDGGEWGLAGIGAGAEEAAEPAAGGESAVFHVVLGLEVGAGFVFGAGAVDDGEIAGAPPGVEGFEVRVESEESVEVDEVGTFNADAGSCGVVEVVSVGDDHVESVGAAAEEDDDEGA
jgi:hypothetical protein